MHPHMLRIPPYRNNIVHSHSSWCNSLIHWCSYEWAVTSRSTKNLLVHPLDGGKVREVFIWFSIILYIYSKIDVYNTESHIWVASKCDTYYCTMAVWHHHWHVMLRRRQYTHVPLRDKQCPVHILLVKVWTPCCKHEVMKPPTLWEWTWDGNAVPFLWVFHCS